MPSNVNFQIPFLGGAGEITNQILAALHFGGLQRYQQQQVGLERQRVQNETQRDAALNKLAQAQIDHATTQTAYEKETNPTSKQLLLNQLHKSTIDLALASHQAKFFGIDVDALQKSAGQEAEPQSTAPGAGAAVPPQTTPSPFEQELDKTKKLLGSMTPDEEAMFNNASETAKRTLNVVPVTSALAAITQRRTAAGGEPLGPDRITQLNQALATRYNVLNPGADLPPAFRLAGNATQKDYDRIDKVMEGTERALLTKSQQNISNEIRQQTLELSQEKEGMKWAQWTDDKGNQVAGPVSEGKKQGAKDMAELPTQEVRDVQNARHAVRLFTKTGPTNKPETQGVLQLIDSLEKDGKLGILASRWNAFMTTGVGAAPDDDPRIITLINKNMLGDTATMLAHFGASGGRSPQMLQHFTDLANARKMDGPTLKAGVLAISDYMHDRAMLPEEKKTNAAPSGLTPTHRYNQQTGQIEEIKP